MCFALTWIVSSPASAGNSDAPASAGDDPIAKAQALDKSKKPKDAAEQWEKAFESTKDPKHLFHAAKDRQKGADPAGAANDYARFLAVLKDKPVSDKELKKEKATASKELANLQKTLGRFALRATGSSEIRVDGYAIDSARAEEWYVSVGPHVIEAKFETGVGKENATAEKGKLVPVVIAAPIEGENGAPPAAKPEDKAATEDKAAGSSDKGPVQVSTSRGKFSLPPFWFYVLGGVTVVVGGLTVFSAIDVGSKKDDFDKARTQENLDAGKSAQTRTNILLVTSGVLVALTAVTAVVLVDWKRTDTKLGLGPGSLYLQKTF
jgi:hypothetical protein